MIWILYVLGGLVGLMLIATAIGACTPVDHTASRALRLSKTPEEVWRVVSDHANEASWNPILKGVERLPDKDGHEVWRQLSRSGPPMVLETTEKVAPRRMVRTISDEKQAFSGSWEFALEPAEGGTRLRITERGHVPNPFFRFMIKLYGPTRYMEMYMNGLAKHFGEVPRIES